MRKPESYQEARYKRQRIARRLRWVVVALAAYELVTSLGLKSMSATSNGMEPTIRRGDHLLVLPSAYGIASSSLGPSYTSPRRGDIVVMRPPYARPMPWYARAFWAVADFVTLHRLPASLRPREELILKRVIALPGDTVYLEGFLAMVREGGGAHFLTEYEVSGRSYDLSSAGLPEGWPAELPLSGSFPAYTLGEGEYFVLGDNRLNYADSRFFGPIRAQHIVAKVALRYWPFNAKAIQ